MNEDGGQEYSSSAVHVLVAVEGQRVMANTTEMETGARLDNRRQNVTGRNPFALVEKAG